MGEWISVKERMPDMPIEVFCTGLDYGRGPNRHYARCLFNAGGFYEMTGEDSGEFLEYITHWMPCDPPK